MAEVVVKEIDAQGRITIPRSWRKNWKSNKIIMTMRDDRIEVTPLKPTRPSELFDSIEISDDVDFTDPHSLKKALLELRDR